MRVGLPVLIAPVLALAQQPLAFDVASVKVSPPIGGLNALIFRAYGVEGDQIVGIPNEFRYPLSHEIDATFPADTNKDEVPMMLQTLRLWSSSLGSNWSRRKKRSIRWLSIMRRACPRKTSSVSH
jgi:hypothetical protein